MAAISVEEAAQLAISLAKYRDNCLDQAVACLSDTRRVWEARNWRSIANHANAVLASLDPSGLYH